MSKKKGLIKKDPRIGTMVEYNEELSDCYIFDLDGTISLMNNRSIYKGEDCDTDVPNWPVIKTVRRLNNEDTFIFIFSGRNGESIEETCEWLLKHEVPYDALYMRPFKNMEKDTVVKQEMFDTLIKDKFNVLGIFDDRDVMINHWRAQGLPAYQVYYGNF